MVGLEGIGCTQGGTGVQRGPGRTLSTAPSFPGPSGEPEDELPTFVGRLKDRIDRLHGAATRYRTKHLGRRRLPEWVPAHTPHLTGIPLVDLGISNQHSIRTWPLHLMNDFPIEALKNGRSIHTRLRPVHSPECHLVEVGP